MVNDPVADFLVQLKNASRAGKRDIDVPYSILKHSIADILKNRGLLTSVEKRGKKVRKVLSVTLSDSALETLRTKRLSKPSRRVYVKSKDIHPVRAGKGIAILSTPKGVLSGEDARAQGVGGELLCKIW
jgi:small subunit ribosomal protein S8